MIMFWALRGKIKLGPGKAWAPQETTYPLASSGPAGECRMARTPTNMRNMRVKGS